MIDLIGLAASIAVSLIGGIVWLIRLEGRINVHAAMHTSLRERVDSLENRILAQLDRIEDKIDKKADR